MMPSEIKKLKTALEAKGHTVIRYHQLFNGKLQYKAEYGEDHIKVYLDFAPSDNETVQSLLDKQSKFIAETNAENTQLQIQIDEKIISTLAQNVNFYKKVTLDDFWEMIKKGYLSQIDTNNRIVEAHKAIITDLQEILTS